MSKIETSTIKAYLKELKFKCFLLKYDKKYTGK